MTVGLLAYSESSYFPVRNMPVDNVRWSVSATQSAASSEAAGNEKLSPINPRTALNAKIYASNRVRINEHMFDNAPLTKSAAHIRARAKLASENLLASMGRRRSISSASVIAMPTRPSAKAAAKTDGNGESAAAANEALKPHTGCDTCESRVYQDGSDDSGVSYQSAKGMPASMSGVRVASHEGEHVTRESARALEEGNIVTQKKVTMQTSFCPECHRMYYSGGSTTIAAVGSGSPDSSQGQLSVRNAADSLTNLGNAVDLFI